MATVEDPEAAEGTPRMHHSGEDKPSDVLLEELPARAVHADHCRMDQDAVVPVEKGTGTPGRASSEVQGIEKQCPREYTVGEAGDHGCRLSVLGK